MLTDPLFDVILNRFDIVIRRRLDALDGHALCGAKVVGERPQRSQPRRVVGAHRSDARAKVANGLMTQQSDKVLDFNVHTIAEVATIRRVAATVARRAPHAERRHARDAQQTHAHCVVSGNGGCIRGTQ